MNNELIIMNTKQIYNKLIAGLFCCFLFIVPCLLSSCESWVDVTPDDRIVETTVFERQQGYQKLLNGLYSGMSSTSLYGRNMSALIDVMGQIYLVDKYHNYGPIAHFNYGEDQAKNMVSTIWNNSYSIISNANALIEHTDDADCPLSERQKSRMKAEALTVRAFIHFDLLRLFGPVPSEMSNRAIPYQTSSKLDVQPFETGAQILSKIKADLTEAVRLLQTTEPLLNPDNYTADDLASRPYRFNYFAVKAVLARVYLYEGDKANALREATEVINAGEQFFPATTSAAAGSSSTPDRVFSSEVLFGLYDTSRSTHLYNTLFTPTLTEYNILTVAGGLGTGRLAEWYDDQNDYRYKIWAVDVEDGNDKLHQQKYKNVTDGGDLNFIIPLVRMGEMYLIAAECATNTADATKYLNTLRNRRNCFSVELSDTNLRDYLTLEFRKEMLGEGQMFFYFKRCEMTQLPNSERTEGTISMSLSSYVVPLPDSELSMREGFND